MREWAEPMQAEAMIRNPEQSSNSQTSNSQSETSTLGALEEHMCKMMESFHQRLDQLDAKIDGTSEVEGTSTEIPPSPTPPRQTSLSWAERSINEVPDYSPILRWPDDEDTNGQSLVEVSEPTASNSPHHQLYQTAGERDKTVAEEELLHTKG